MTSPSTLLFAIATVVAVFNMSSARAADAWQNSWEKFVENYNGCVKADCDKKQFANKTVTWVAPVGSFDDKDGGVTMDMSASPPFVDKEGKKSNKIGLTLIPTEGQKAAWSKVAPGQKVRFKAKTIEIFGSPVGFTSMGMNENIAIVFTEGGELVEVLAGP